MNGHKILGKNRKAWHLYEVLETIETGIVLQGTEVKSLRLAHFNFADAYASIEKSELWLLALHINPYTHGNLNNHEALRARKLLVSRDEIRKLRRKTEEKGLTLVPLSLYLKGGLIKVELGVCRGKKLYDKRHDIKAKDQKRDSDRETRRMS
jgi:SsrA-binding protein